MLQLLMTLKFIYLKIEFIQNSIKTNPHHFNSVVCYFILFTIIYLMSLFWLFFQFVMVMVMDFIFFIVKLKWFIV